MGITLLLWKLGGCSPWQWLRGICTCRWVLDVHFLLPHSKRHVLLDFGLRFWLDGDLLGHNTPSNILLPLLYYPYSLRWLLLLRVVLLYHLEVLFSNLLRYYYLLSPWYRLLCWHHKYQPTSQPIWTIFLPPVMSVFIFFFTLSIKYYLSFSFCPFWLL